MSCIVIVLPPWSRGPLWRSRAAAPSEAVVVDAVVAVEALVLDRDGRVLQVLRDAPARDHGAVGLAGDDAEEVLVLVVDARVLAEADLLEVAAVQALAHGVDREGRHQHEAAHASPRARRTRSGDVLALAVGAPPAAQAPPAEVAHAARQRQGPDVPGDAAPSCSRAGRSSAAGRPAPGREPPIPGGIGALRPGFLRRRLGAAGGHRYREGAVLVDQLDARGHGGATGPDARAPAPRRSRSRPAARRATDARRGR